MKLRHGAALLSVGWYLLAPIPQLDPATGLPNGKPNLSAPFRYWSKVFSFDSAKECEAERVRQIDSLFLLDTKIREEDRSEEEQAEWDEMEDQVLNLPEGWSHGLRSYGLTSALRAQCIASDDPRLKEK